MHSLVSWFKHLVVAVFLATLSVNLAAGDEPNPLVRIEEDWELVVQSPDAALDAPQIVMAFSPLGNIQGLHATLELNHISSVLFAPGGIHLSVWNGATHLAVKHAGNYAILSKDSETIRWTQVIELQDDIITFRIENGTSTTWGNFNSKDHDLKISVQSSVDTLTAYSPTVSVDQSDVSYAGNRVRSLAMKKVRYIKQSGQVTEDATERIAHTSESDSAE